MASLETRLSTSKKKASEGKEKGFLNMQGNSQVKSSGSFNFLSSSSCENKKQHQFLVKDDVITQFNLSKNETASLNEKMDFNNLTEEVWKNSNNETTTLAEPKYRFANRKRPGSFIFISRKNYQQLMKGNSIKCVNSKIGSPLFIRLVQNKDDQEKREVSHEVQLPPTTVDYFQPDARDQRKDDADMENSLDYKKNKENSKRRKETMASQQSNEFEIVPPCNNSAPIFKQDQSSKMGVRKRAKMTQCRAKKARTKLTSTTEYTQLSIRRYTTGRKRKAVNQQIGLDQHPKKKPLFESTCTTKFSCNVIKSYVSLVNFCTNNSLQVQGSSKQIAKETLESVYAARME